MADDRAVQTSPTSRKGIWGWMLFDFAAQPFFTVVTTFIFGPYFVSRMTTDPIAAQTTWSNIATISSIIIAIFSPILGSIADKSGARKPWIASFAAIKILCLALLWYAAPGSPVLFVAVLIILATIAAEFSIVFNDSMITRLTSVANVGKISNIAWGLGYLGGMLVLIAVVLFITSDLGTGKTILGFFPLFGLDATTGEDARITGPIAAFWYLLFILPMFLFTPDAPKAMQLGPAVRKGTTELKSSLRDLLKRKYLTRFFIARMLYQDGINGVLVLGGVFAAGMFGWMTMEIGIFGMLLNTVAIAGCLIAGRIDQNLGSRRTILIGLGLFLIGTIGIVSTTTQSTLFGLIQLSHEDSGGLFATGAEKAYLAFGLFIGAAFGPVQASSRAFLARNITVEDSGKYFGLYALTGRATSFMATLSFSIVTYVSGSAHLGMASLIVFLGLGCAMLVTVPDRLEA